MHSTGSQTRCSPTARLLARPKRRNASACAERLKGSHVYNSHYLHVDSGRAAPFGVDVNTPRTDEAAFRSGMEHEYVEAEFARKLERELNAALETGRALRPLAFCGGLP